jgi:hypothetical protein
MNSSKCWCGVTLDTDSERIAHDCDYYPADIMERDELWVLDPIVSEW